VHAVAPRDKQTEVRHVHHSQLKPVPALGSLPVPVVRPQPLAPNPDTEDAAQWVVVRHLPPANNPQSAGAQTPSEQGLAQQTAAISVTLPRISSCSAPGPPVVRRSTRATAGTHPNPHHLPVSLEGRANEATNSQILGASTFPAICRLDFRNCQATNKTTQNI